MAMSIDERQELALELYRSRHGLSSTTALNPTGTIGRNKNGTTSKKSGTTSATLGKSPPRPSPGKSLNQWIFQVMCLNSISFSVCRLSQRRRKSQVLWREPRRQQCHRKTVGSQFFRLTGSFYQLFVEFLCYIRKLRCSLKVKTRACDQMERRSSITTPTSTTLWGSHGSDKNPCETIQAIQTRSLRVRRR